MLVDAKRVGRWQEMLGLVVFLGLMFGVTHLERPLWHWGNGPARGREHHPNVAIWGGPSGAPCVLRQTIDHRTQTLHTYTQQYHNSDTSLPQHSKGIQPNAGRGWFGEDQVDCANMRMGIFCRVSWHCSVSC